MPGTLVGGLEVVRVRSLCSDLREAGLWIVSCLPTAVSHIVMAQIELPSGHLWASSRG